MKKEDMIRRAIGGIDDKLVDGAKASPSLKKRPLWIKYGTVAAAVLLFVSIVVAVPFAVNKGENRPAIPVESNVIPAESDKITNPMATIMQTDPVTDADQQRIIYDKYDLPSTEMSPNSEDPYGPGVIRFYFDWVKEDIIFDKENSDALFYCALDFRNNSLCEDPQKYIDEHGEEEYYKIYSGEKAVLEKEDLMYKFFAETGIASKIKERGNGIFICLLSQSDIQKLMEVEAPVISWFHLLPEGCTLEDYYYHWYLDPNVAKFE